MINTLLGEKKTMSHTYEDGKRIAATRIVAGPCVVVRIREEKGMWFIELGFGERKIKKMTKPLIGHLKGAIKDDKAPYFLREIGLTEKPDFKVGDKVKITDVLAVGDIVQITGTSKGKGFAGVVKRWRFAGGPKTHGQSDRLRAPGSIGQGTTPGRVYKGKKMAGRMGGERVTVRNLKVLALDEEKNEVLVSGAVPGRSGGLLMIKRLGKGKDAQG